MFTSSNRWFIRTIASLLAPSYLLIVCVRVNADPLPVAQVYTLNNPGTTTDRRIQLGERNQRTERPAARGDRLADWRYYLWVPGSASATLGYVVGRNPSSIGAAVGPHRTPTTYYFPCGASVGAITVGWSEGRSDERSCENMGLRITVSSRQAALPQPEAQPLAQAKTSAAKSSAPAADPLDSIAQVSRNSNPIFLYCTVASKRRGWWARWGAENDPCQEAFQECFNSGSDEEDCKIVSLGNWRARDQNLDVAVVCSDEQIYTRRGDGASVDAGLLAELVQQAKADRAKACIVDVYHPVEVVIIPATRKETLIQASDATGALAVDVLAGKVVIRSALHPGGVAVEVNNRYTYPQDSVEPIDASEVAQSPSVRTFLDPTNWPPNDGEEVEEFQSALGRSVRGGNILNVLVPVFGALLGGLLIHELTNDGESEEEYPPEGQVSEPESSQSGSTGTSIQVVDSLQITPVVPRMEVQPSGLTFDFRAGNNIPLADRQNPQTVTVKNSGSASLSISGVSVRNVTVDDLPSGDTTFFQTSGCANGIIAPGSSCDITVRFVPKGAGTYRATLAIATNAGEQTVSLTGEQPILLR